MHSTARLTDEEFMVIFSKVPRVCVDLVILDRVNSRVLLIKRGIKPFLGYWGVVGGSIYVDESPQQAMDRHTRTDLGIEIREIGLAGVFQNIYTSGDYPPNLIVIAYAVEIAKFEPIILSLEATEFAWYNYDALPDKMGWTSREEVEAAVRLWG